LESSNPFFFEGAGLLYCEGGAARSILINNFNWVFDDERDQGTNEFLSTSGSWTDDTNWSLMRTPSFCNDVIIDGVTTGDVTISNNNFGKGATLEVREGSSIEVDLGSSLEVKVIPPQ